MALAMEGESGASELPGTPKDVLSMAEYLGIRTVVDPEYFLFPVAREAVAAPLLEPWVEQQDEDGNPIFINQRSGFKSVRHPLDTKFLKLSQRIRENPPPGALRQRTVMEFRREQGGGTYFYDFATGATLDSCEDYKVLGRLHPDLLPRYNPEQLMLTRTVVSRRARRAAIKQLRVLCFKSWWYEDIESPDLSLRVSSNSVCGGGITKRYATIRFHLDSGAIDVDMETADQMLRLKRVASASARGGMPVQCWDLHIGGTLELLGRPIILRWADGETVEWLEWFGVRLRELKEQLIVDVTKYKFRPQMASVTSTQGEVVPGGTNLANLTQQIENLLQQLHAYRPKRAAQWRAKLEAIQKG